MLTDAQAKQIAEKVSAAMLDTMERLIREGHDQRGVLEATRDILVEKFGFSLLAAANLTRLMLAAVAKRLNCPAPYSQADLATIHQIVCAN